MKKVYDIIGIIGIVLTFLTAGMSDAGTLSFTHTVLMAMFSLALMFISFYGVNFEVVDEIIEECDDIAESATPDCPAHSYANR